MNSHRCEVEVDKEQLATLLPGDVSLVCRSLAPVSKRLAPSGQTRGTSGEITAALWCVTTKALENHITSRIAPVRQVPVLVPSTT